MVWNININRVLALLRVPGPFFGSEAWPFSQVHAVLAHSAGEALAYRRIEAAFIEGLSATGFIEGKNISIEWRWADSQYNRLSLLASELDSRGVAVIDVPAALPAKAAIKTTPTSPCSVCSAPGPFGRMVCASLSRLPVSSGAVAEASTFLPSLPAALEFDF